MEILILLFSWSKSFTQTTILLSPNEYWFIRKFCSRVLFFVQSVATSSLNYIVHGVVSTVYSSELCVNCVNCVHCSVNQYTGCECESSLSIIPVFLFGAEQWIVVSWKVANMRISLQGIVQMQWSLGCIQ